MYVTTTTFEKHLQYLAEHFETISLQEVREKSVKKNSCIITFDDGWADNYTNALPLLRKYNIPATIFLTTNLVGSNSWPWPDRISYYVYKGDRDLLISLINMIPLSSSHTRLPRPLLFLTRSSRSIIAERVINTLKSFDENSLLKTMEIIDKMFNLLKEQLYTLRPWLSWEEVCEMEEAGLTFGAHTHNHKILSSISHENAHEEICKSREVLYSKLKRPLDIFCYPNGNYNDEIISIVRDCGFIEAVTTNPGYIECDVDPFLLPRILLHDDISNTVPMFVWNISRDYC